MAVALAPTQSTVFGAANVFTQADLASWDSRRRVSKRRAHAHLSDMRREMHANAENSRCLNDDELIGDYACSRPDAPRASGRKDRPGFYVRYTGGEGIIDVLNSTPGPFKAVADLDSVMSFA